MDVHQKISIGIFGALLLGTMTMFSTGGLSSNALNSNAVNDADPCGEVYMKEYADAYTADKEIIDELQQFVRRNCRGEVVESKKSYCDAKKKQITTYSAQITRYEQCIKPQTPEVQ